MPVTDTDFDLRVRRYDPSLSFNSVNFLSVIPLTFSLLLLHSRLLLLLSQSGQFAFHFYDFSLFILIFTYIVFCFQMCSSLCGCLGFLMFLWFAESTHLPMWVTWSIVPSTWTRRLLPLVSLPLSISLLMIRCVSVFLDLIFFIFNDSICRIYFLFFSK